MTVTGATTAQIASTSYSPPFKYVSTNAPTVQITGTVTGSTNNNPTVSAGASDSDYAWAYLQAHMMSPPSYRSAYLLWMVLGVIALLYAISHHLKLSGGSFGASLASFGIRRHVIGSKKPGRRNRALPSNNVIFTVTVIAAVTITLCLIGADYIAPDSSILDFSTSFKRAVQSSTSPKYTIGKSFWTLGSRFGYMAFALFPAVVLFALKSSPAAILSFRFFTHLHADKLAVLHRGGAWLVWAITTAHVALWTVQLFKDSRNGRATWFYLWTNYRFIFGCVAYAALSAVMVMSVRPVRKNQYEIFYVSHVVLVIVTLAACVVHHPVLWYWIVAAGGLWAVDRVTRLLRFARTNAVFAGTVSRTFQAGPDYAHVPTHENYAMQDLKPSYVDKTLPLAPRSTAHMGNGSSDFGLHTTRGYYDEGSLQPLGSYESRYGTGSTDPYNAYAQPRPISDPDANFTARPSSSELEKQSENLPVSTESPIPTGFALAQLLPSRTVRLTIRPPRPFAWAPGQSCLLYLPELSKLQSHPFTIVNSGEEEIVLLVKARKGLTRRLYNIVRDRSLAAAAAQSKRVKHSSSISTATAGVSSVQMAPVHVRALVDGPFGSAGRVRWNEFSTVIIICGGSGVSFGSAICDHVCQIIAKNRDIVSRKVSIQRVRFCWVVREYAEIAWVASQLYRCQTLVTSVQLEISIFVTNANRVRDEYALPQPGFAHGSRRRDSQDSAISEMSQDSTFELDSPAEEPQDPSTQYADVIDLTNYDDEEDVNDPAEQQLSNQVQQQGKVRRARSRKAYKAAAGIGRVSNQPRRGPSMLGLGNQEHNNGRSSRHDDEGDYNRADPSPRYGVKMPLEEPSPSRFSAIDSRHQSYRSVSDSTYSMYDPYVNMGGTIRPSPSPSIMNFDDTRSIAGESVRNLLSRTSRTGSMVFLEEHTMPIEGDTSQAGLWIDEADFAAMNVMSEMAKPGKPKLSALIEEEIHRAGGSMIVATCGPVTLNTVVRNLVAKHNSPARIRRGDKRGRIAIYSEDYET